MNGRIRFVVTPFQIVIALLAIALAIAIIHVVSQAPRYFDFRFPLWRELGAAFHMGKEANVSAWYSSILLFVAGVLLALVAQLKRQDHDRYRWHWVALAAIFIYLSVDEAAILHENIGTVLGQRFSSDFLRFGGWVGFAVVGMSIFAVIFLPFWLALEQPTKWLFALAGSLYVGGAMGVESLAVPYEVGQRPTDFGRPLLTALEEFMEMSGMAVFIGSLFHYLGKTWGVVALDFNSHVQDSSDCPEPMSRAR